MLIDYTEIIKDDLKDPDFAAGLLSMYLEEEGFGTFLVSLRDIVKVRGGMTALAKKTGLNRESLQESRRTGTPCRPTPRATSHSFAVKVE